MSGGENCILSAAGYGSVSVAISGFSHGIEIIGSQDQARTRKAFYVSARTSTAFTITLLLGSDRSRYDLFVLWLKSYCDRRASPNGSVSDMRVQVPSRGFDRLAVPKSGIRFGDNLDEVGRKMSLSFIGARSPGDYLNPISSKFTNTTDADARYFYPGGVQLTAADDVEDVIFGLTKTIDFGAIFGLGR